MFYDLNIPWSTNTVEIQRTLAFLAELGYDVVALNHTINGKLPADLKCPIPDPLPFTVPTKLKILRRCTLVYADNSMNHRLHALSLEYDLLALRPITEQNLNHICTQVDCDLLSIDMSQRYPFPFKRKALGSAISKGIRIELCYSVGLDPDKIARRNMCSNATSIIRSSKGRNIIISSEASKALLCRGPWDVVNLGTIWGLPQDRGLEAINREARAVVVKAHTRKTNFRGVVDVVYGGEKPAPKTKEAESDGEGSSGGKEKIEELSKRQKRKLTIQGSQKDVKKQKVDGQQQTKEEGKQGKAEAQEETKRQRIEAKQSKRATAKETKKSKRLQAQELKGKPTDDPHMDTAEN